MRTVLRRPARWVSIIGALWALLLLGGCSANRLAYHYAPTWGHYTLNAYFDLDAQQSAAVKDGLRSLQAWHRKQELPQLAELLGTLQTLAAQDLSPAQVCSLWAALQQRMQAPLWYFTPELAQWASTLQPAQLRHAEAEFKWRNAQWGKEWLDMPVVERLDKRSAQMVERMEQFYGSLSKAQEAQIRSQLQQAGYDAEVQHKEMLRRQQDSLQTLAALRDAALTTEQRQAALRGLFARALVSPEPGTRQYFEGMTRATCGAVAGLHNEATPTQKAHLRKTLQGYEADVRALMQNP